MQEDSLGDALDRLTKTGEIDKAALNKLIAVMGSLLCDISPELTKSAAHSVQNPYFIHGFLFAARLYGESSAVPAIITDKNLLKTIHGLFDKFFQNNAEAIIKSIGKRQHAANTKH